MLLDLVALALFTSGAGGGSLSSFAASGTSAEEEPSAGGGSLSAFAATGTGIEGFLGSGGAALSSFAGSGTGGEGEPSLGSSTLSPFAASGTGAETFAASGSAALSSFACSGSGAEGITGSGSPSLSSFAASGAGAEQHTGLGGGTMTPFVASGSATETFAGTGAATLSVFLPAGAAAETEPSAGSAALSPFAVSGVALEQEGGSGGGFLSAFTVAAAGAEQEAGSGGGFLSPFTTSGIGTDDPTGGGTCAMSPFATTGGGMVVLGGLDLPGELCDLPAFAEASRCNDRSGELVALLAGVLLRDTTLPVISNMSGATISRTAPITFDITDNASHLDRVVIEATHLTGSPEVAYDNTFKTGYTVGSSASSIFGGKTFVVTRDAGWPTGQVTLRIIARDTDGNEATPTDYVFTVTNPSVGPTIANFLPAPGTPISRSTPVEFDVTDVVLIRRVVVEANLGGATELVHDGDGFSPGYATSSRTAISGGFHYLVARQGGWPSAPTIKVIAVDSSGNES